MLDAVNDAIGRADNSAASEKSADSPRRDPGLRWLRLFAVIFGIAGTILSLMVPFMPVRNDVTTLQWPTAAGGTQAVSAQLESYSPLWLNATVPCSAAQTAAARTAGTTVLVGTNAPESAYGRLTGLFLQVDHGQLSVLDRGQTLGTAPLPGGNCTIRLHSDPSSTSATINGQQIALGRGNQLPQMTEIYSDINSKLDNTHGLSFTARVDTRFENVPTVLKIVVISFAVLCFLCSVVCLRRLDVRVGRRPPRWAPAGWWKPTLRDFAVVGALIIWWLIGAMTSDDGYIFTIARARESAGYVSNYFRWFGSPDTPFAWFEQLYSFLVQVSTATPFVRLPALAMGIACWLLISRELLPRLGQQVRRSNAAGWAGAAVFLAFWMPYDNGLRPEPVVVLFWLLAVCAVERSIATKRLMPAAVGLVGAALALGADPEGLVGVLPFLVGIKPLFRLVRQRAKEFGWLPVLAPVSACGFAILPLIFVDQTWASTMTGVHLRYELGPGEHWYQEIDRYNELFSQTPDGSLARRFPVLLVILCLVICMMVLLRRGRIRGAALGPSRRLLGTTALGFVALALAPTKWSHHFGIFAAVGGAVAALTALATGSTVLRSRRNRAGFFAGLMVVCAVSVTGPNGFWYVSGWGVPWFDKPPSIDGHQASTAILLIAAVAGIVALIEHLRLDERHPQIVPDVKKADLEKRSRALRLGTAPLSVVCALLIVSELLTFGKVIQKQWGTYSMGADNVKQLAGQSCGLSDYVEVEPNPLAGMLTPMAVQPTSAAPNSEPLPSRLAGKTTPDTYLRAGATGSFHPVGPATSTAPVASTSTDTNPPPDSNPPYGFGGPQAPVWGSWDSTGTGTGELHTPWYNLPPQAANGHVPVVVTVAGSTLEGDSLMAEYGKNTPRGFQVMSRQAVPPGTDDGPEWRDTRVLVPPEAKGAQQVRLVAVDSALGPDGWLAVSAPRVPKVETMTQYVGKAPTFIEWPAALVYPCLNTAAISHGVAQMPKFLISGGTPVRDVGAGWSSPEAGGPFGYMDVAASVQAVPAYLRGDMELDWGSLYKVEPFGPAALPAGAAMHRYSDVHSGMWQPGPPPNTVTLPGPVPNSEDRNDLNGTGTGTL